MCINISLDNMACCIRYIFLTIPCHLVSEKETSWLRLSECVQVNRKQMQLKHFTIATNAVPCCPHNLCTSCIHSCISLLFKCQQLHAVCFPLLTYTIFMDKYQHASTYTLTNTHQTPSHTNRNLGIIWLHLPFILNPDIALWYHDHKM